jgi:nitroimidazol reductase NimA-like FMN-containing flavoprotein (pyridoxamine 5'-phosphate oxidase superfamily)
MERHEIDAELAITGSQQLLTSGSMVRLAYAGKDGTPRVIPMGFYWTGDQVVVSTAATAPKIVGCATTT